MHRIKRSKGIPLSQLEIVTDIKTPGVMLTSSGQLAVPIINSYVYMHIAQSSNNSIY